MFVDVKTMVHVCLSAGHASPGRGDQLHSHVLLQQRPYHAGMTYDYDAMRAVV
jgi:hypothetical protein